MFKKVIPHAIILLLMVGAGTWLALDLRARQESFCLNRSELSRAPLAGFHKLLADFKWIQFIQYCGSVQKLDDRALAEMDGMLRDLFSLDPDFGKGYEVGGLMLSAQAPDKALAFLERAAENPLLMKSNWKIPYLAGFIHLRQIKGTGAADAEHARKAKAYFQQALRVNGVQANVQSCLIQAEVALDKGRPRKLAELEAWFRCLERITPTSASAGEFGMSTDMASGDAVSGLADRGRILARVASLMRQCRAELPGDAAAQQAVERIAGKLQNELHLCKTCYSTYAAGDRFCGGCGKSVEPYGICPACGQPAGGTAYCAHCGNRLKAP